jgi:hypothetical protein
MIFKLIINEIKIFIITFSYLKKRVNLILIIKYLLSLAHENIYKILVLLLSTCDPYPFFVCMQENENVGSTSKNKGKQKVEDENTNIKLTNNKRKQEVDSDNEISKTKKIKMESEESNISNLLAKKDLERVKHMKNTAAAELELKEEIELEARQEAKRIKDLNVLYEDNVITYEEWKRYLEKGFKAEHVIGYRRTKKWIYEFDSDEAEIPTIRDRKVDKIYTDKYSDSLSSGSFTKKDSINSIFDFEVKDCFSENYLQKHQFELSNLNFSMIFFIVIFAMIFVLCSFIYDLIVLTILKNNNWKK